MVDSEVDSQLIIVLFLYFNLDFNGKKTLKGHRSRQPYSARYSLASRMLNIYHPGLGYYFHCDFDPLKCWHFNIQRCTEVYKLTFLVLFARLYFGSNYFFLVWPKPTVQLRNSVYHGTTTAKSQPNWKTKILTLQITAEAGPLWLVSAFLAKLIKLKVKYFFFFEFVKFLDYRTAYTLYLPLRPIFNLQLQALPSYGTEHYTILSL